MTLYLPLKNHYNVYQTIGKGTYGEVKLAVQCSSGKEVAIKILRKENLSSGMHAAIRLEIFALQTLKHQHICPLLDVIESHEAFFMILELVSGGDLFDFIISKDFISEEETRPIFLQIAQTMAFVHEKGFAHLDIKPENVLIDENNHIKLIDFGMCAYPPCGLASLLKRKCGTVLYAAPEIKNGTPYLGAKADMWSMGVLLYVMLTGEDPFERHFNFDAIRHHINTGQISYPPSTTEEAIDLIQGLMKVDPEQRLSIDDVINHPWINVNNANKVESSFLTSANQLAQNELRNEPHPRDSLSSRAPQVSLNNAPLDDNNNADVSVSRTPTVPDNNADVNVSVRVPDNNQPETNALSKKRRVSSIVSIAGSQSDIYDEGDDILTSADRPQKRRKYEMPEHTSRETDNIFDDLFLLRGGQ